MADKTIQLTLNVSDSNYNDLFRNAEEMVLSSPEFVEALKAKMIEEAGDYVRSNPRPTAEALGVGNTYGNKLQEEIVRKIVREAVNAELPEIKAGFYDFLINLLTPENVTRMFKEIIVGIIKDAFTGDIQQKLDSLGDYTVQTTCQYNEMLTKIKHQLESRGLYSDYV